MQNRPFLIILILVLITAMSVTAKAAECTLDVSQKNIVAQSSYENFTWGDFLYRILDDGSVNVIGYTGTNSVIEIPREIEGRTVTALRTDMGGMAVGENYNPFFGDNTNRKSIEIPDTVTAIGYGTFWNSGSLSSINVSPSNLCYQSIDGVLYNKDATIILACPGGKDTVAIPNSVITIGDGAFAYCKNLTDLVVPEGVTSICKYAFIGCTGLISINIPKNLKSFGGSVYKFSGAGVSSDGRSIFSDCSNLKSINVDSENEIYSSVDGVLYNKDVTKLIAYPAGRITAVIPNSVLTIGNSSFVGCLNLKSIEIPYSVKYIEEEAFKICPSLSDIFFTGTEEEWNNIIINKYNYALENVTIHFSSQMSEIYSITLGDVNGDNKITAKDSMVIQRYVVNLIKLDETQLRAADINGDMKVTNKDALAILRYTIGLKVDDLV